MTTNPKQLFYQTLKQHNYSITQPRKIVFELLWLQEPQSMNQLVKRSKDKIDRASLYRAIDLFEKLELVKRIYIGWKYKIELNEQFSHHHHHLTCLECGKIISFEEGTGIEKVLRELAHSNNFEIKDHQLEIQGFCSSCKALKK